MRVVPSASALPGQGATSGAACARGAAAMSASASRAIGIRIFIPSWRIADAAQREAGAPVILRS
jgi:hypothetical protein